MGCIKLRKLGIYSNLSSKKKNKEIKIYNLTELKIENPNIWTITATTNIYSLPLTLAASRAPPPARPSATFRFIATVSLR